MSGSAVLAVCTFEEEIVMAGQWKGTIRWLSVGLIAIMCMFVSLNASADYKAKRMLLVGDSWPFFMWVGGLAGVNFWDGCAAQDGVDLAGYSDWAVYGGDTAVPMSMAREWRDNLPHSYQGTSTGLLDIIRAELANYPTLDIAHVSLGGNDIGRGYYNDVMPQQIRFSAAPTSGTFTLTFEGQTTSALAFNATAAQIQTALQALSTIGAGKVDVTGSVGGPFICQFDSALVAYVADGPDYNLSASSGNLVGGTVIIDEAHHGWEESWGTDSAYEKLFFEAVCAGIEKVVTTILDIRPDIRVAVCDYDYLKVDWGGANELNTRYAGMRLADAKYEMTKRISAMTQYKNRCFFLCPAGLMQYVYGYPNDSTDGVPTTEQIYGVMGSAGTGGTVQRPQSNPLPVRGGDINYICPSCAILAGIGGGDIHLNKIGYTQLMKYCVEEFYGEWLDYPKALSVVPIIAKATAPDLSEEKSLVMYESFTVTFSEDVTGVDETDFQVAMNGMRTGATIASVDPGPTDYSDTYTVTVECGSGKGTLTVNVVDNGTIKDHDGNTLAGNIDGSFTSGTLYNPSEHSLPVAALPVAIALACCGLWSVKRRGC